MYKKGDIIGLKKPLETSFFSKSDKAIILRMENESCLLMIINQEIDFKNIKDKGSFYEIIEFKSSQGLKIPIYAGINQIYTVNKDNILEKLGELPLDTIMDIEKKFIKFLFDETFPETEKELRNAVDGLTESFYHKIHSRRNHFDPGETYLSYAGRVFDDLEMKNLVNSSLDFWLTSGQYSNEFNKEFSKYLGVNHSILTNSGSSANLLAISALTSPKLGDRRLKTGDEVITTACAFPTTVGPIIQNNLSPVFVDVDIGTYNIQAEKIENAITEKTKAIFTAHTLGNPFNLALVSKICKKHDLWLIEDNCDALGSKYNHKYTGTFGDISTFSFYPAHHMTMGEGGALTTDDSLLKVLIESFRDWGRDCWCEPGKDDTCNRRFQWQLGTLPFGYDHKYIYSHIGYNLKLTDMQAAVGLAQLDKLETFIDIRKKNWEIIYDGLKDYDNYFILPEASQNADPSWFGFLLTIREEAPFSRNDITNHLEKNKIATRLLFSGNITRHPCFDGVKYKVFENLDNTDIITNNTFWLGVYPGLNQDMLDYMLKVIHDFLSQY